MRLEWSRHVFSSALLLLIPAGISAQSSDAPAKFGIADVHTAAKSSIPFPRNFPPRNGRYELVNASMVDLINFAYGMDPDRILGGPSWIEMDRFDVIAKEPAGTTREMRMPMLQALLTERFGLVVRQETRPLPAYALTAGKNPRLKQADGSEQTGCRPVQATGQPSGNGIRIVTGGGPNGPQSIDLGPGQTIPFQCRNMTMQAFVEGLPRMMGTPLGAKRVVDETGLKGAWNFDVKWSINFFAGTPDSGERIGFADALEKQLGLKLEERRLPAEVIVVEKVNRTPTPNDPQIAEKLPKIPEATEFEVADIKPSAPGGRAGGIRMTPGGRWTAQNMPLGILVNRAFSAPGQNAEIAGLPDWANTERFDVTAKAPDGFAVNGDAIVPMLRSLLVDRFKMKYHSETRELQAYSLVTARPKMKKADPESRAHCREDDNATPGPGGTRTLVCQNVTMAQLADRLQNFAFQLRWPVLDETELDGTWDFSLSYSPMAGFGPGRGGEPAANGAAPIAADPTGGITIFDAVQKQLGLKLESRKRPEPVIVIDRIEPQPTEN